jgi:ABC-type dipeptide/oligopeptide/nickel transport system permease component
VTAYAIRRFLGLIPVLFGVSLLVFTFIHLIPGDPAVVMLGQRATPQALEKLRKQLNLDKPLFFNVKAAAEEKNPAALFKSQYFSFANRILHGDLGESIFTKVDVAAELRARFPATFELSLGAMLVAVLVAIPAGIMAAVRKNSWVDLSVMTAALIGISMPIFWLGLLLIYLFAVNLHWLPPSGRLDVGLQLKPITGMYVLDGLLHGNLAVTINALKHLILPALALGSIPTAVIARMMRGAMLEVMNQDYIRTARSKGLAEKIVIWKHALRNAMLPVITIIGLMFGTLLTGAILTETIFNWPGIGKWLYDGIGARDYPIVQGGTLFIATVYVIINALVDLSYGFFDPRVQYH